MSKFLTDEERLQLNREHEADQDARRCDRIKAVLAYDAGYSLAEIASVLQMGTKAVRRHIKRYQKTQKCHAGM